ncbi:unnamed protein product [marine sediment metagenome]|uniref:Uncharacterized protein n=1 Tax=marine sediment metagenome TaxID=412755 RepID=X1F7F8_9ZZZZ
MKNILRFFTGKTEKVVDKMRDKREEELNESMGRESIKITGGVKLTGRDKNGKVLFVKRQKNLITNAGFDLICDVIGLDAQPSDITHIAIGDGVAGDATKTILTNETDRQAGTYAHTEGTKIFTFKATFTNVVAATEYGCFNDPTINAGDMLNIAGFSSITVDSLEIEVTFTLS